MLQWAGESYLASPLAFIERMRSAKENPDLLSVGVDCDFCRERWTREVVVLTREERRLPGGNCC